MGCEKECTLAWDHAPRIIFMSEVAFARARDMSFLSPSVLPLHLAGLERLASTQPSVRPLRSLLGQGQGFPWVLLAGSRFPRAAGAYSLFY